MGSRPACRADLLIAVRGRGVCVPERAVAVVVRDQSLLGTTSDRTNPAAGRARLFRLEPAEREPTSDSRSCSRVAGESPTALLLFDQTSHLPAVFGTSTATAFGHSGSRGPVSRGRWRRVRQRAAGERLERHCWCRRRRDRFGAQFSDVQLALPRNNRTGPSAMRSERVCGEEGGHELLGRGTCNAVSAVNHVSRREHRGSAAEASRDLRSRAWLGSARTRLRE